MFVETEFLREMYFKFYIEKSTSIVYNVGYL